MFWWLHALALLFFLTYLPRGKHLHIITAIPNCFFRSLDVVKTVPRLVFEKGHRFGVSRVFQFTWKDLLDFYSCTECGRCQACCPAHYTGKALNPKRVIHAGKLNLLANGPQVLAGRPDSLGLRRRRRSHGLSADRRRGGQVSRPRRSGRAPPAAPA